MDNCARKTIREVVADDRRTAWFQSGKRLDRPPGAHFHREPQADVQHENGRNRDRFGRISGHRGDAGRDHQQCNDDAAKLRDKQSQRGFWRPGWNGIQSRCP